MTTRVVLFARAPSAPGKTRLTAHLSAERARALRERLFVDTLSSVRAAGHPVSVCYTPADADFELRALAGDVALTPQREGDLGERMRGAMADATASGAEAVVLVGSDLPTLPAAHVRQAFAILEEPDATAGVRAPSVVLGPTADGGFYLVGARGEMPDIFTDIVWGADDVLARVCRAAHEAGVGVRFAPDWWDVDTAADLRRLPAWYTEFLV